MITKKIEIPTGYLFTSKCSKGELETLSIGDYGKEYNVKADFLGYTKEIKGVKNRECKPLTEKWVITLSTQYGCPMNCNFCDVPKVKFKGNATFQDLKDQFYNALSLFPEIKYTERLNIHFARMGEPIFNKTVFEFSEWLISHKYTIWLDTELRIETIHPVLTTSLPSNFNKLEYNILEWAHIKNTYYNGQAGLQFSINSTDENQRNIMFDNKQLYLDELSEICNKLAYPIGRKYCLNFAYSTDYVINAAKLRALFDPDKFMCKITPIHNNTACKANGIETLHGYDSWEPYRIVEKELKDVGFDVLVFVPSMDEEDGLVTCGNLILSGNNVDLKNSKLNIKGIVR